jgi:hypothetical protein
MSGLGALGAWGAIGSKISTLDDSCDKLATWIIVLALISTITTIYNLYRIKVFYAKDKVSKKADIMMGLVFFLTVLTSNVIWFIYGNFLTYSSDQDECNTKEHPIWSFVRFTVYMGYSLFAIYIFILVSIILKSYVRSQTISHGYPAVKDGCLMKLSTFK